MFNHLVENQTYRFSDSEPIILIHRTLTEEASSRFDMHFAYELGIIKSGIMQREYKNHSRRVESGDVWLTGMWEPHGYFLLEAPCEVFVFVVSPTFLHRHDQAVFNWTDVFNVKPARRPALSPECRQEVLRIANRLSTLPPEHKTLWLKNYFFEILLYLNAGRSRQREVPKKDVFPYQKLEPGIQLVFENKRHVTTEEASRHCGMSRTAFDTLFKNTMGLSYYKFALRFRLRSAADQLLATNDPLKAVASDWGFTDSSHFIRVFKEYYQMSPHDYRSHATKK